MSNWVGGLPPTLKSSPGGDKKAPKKGGKPQSQPDDDHSRVFFGGAIPPTPLKMPKLSLEDLKPPKVTMVGGPPRAPKPPPRAPKLPPPPPPPRPPTPPPPPPPPPSPTSVVCEPRSPPLYTPPPPPLPTRFPSVFDKKPKKKRRKKKKKRPLPPPKPVYVEEQKEEEEEKLGAGLKLPSMFAISHIPATRQGYPEEDEYRYNNDDENEDQSRVTSPLSMDSDDLDIPPEVPRFKRENPFAAIWGKLIDVRNVTEVGPHGWHGTSNAPYDVTDDGDTVTVGASGWHEVRSE